MTNEELADRLRARIEADARRIAELEAHHHGIHCETDCEGWQAAIRAFRESHGVRTPAEFIEEFETAEKRIAELERENAELQTASDADARFASAVRALLLAHKETSVSRADCGLAALLNDEHEAIYNAPPQTAPKEEA